MGKTIEKLKNYQVVGHVGLGMHGDQVGSVKQVVHDGDTINVRGLGNFGIRFLGIDTAEMSLKLPGEGDKFISLSDEKWEEFLSDPFQEDGALSPSPFSDELTEYLKTKVGPGVASNHRKYAEKAEDYLEKIIQEDIGEMGLTTDDFEFYLRFAFEIMDRYGRFLCYINRNQPKENEPTPRPPSYNTRILKSGMASP